MAIPTTRDEFKEFCLRALGSPVLQINVDDSQIEDRIDEALYLYQEFHTDAVAKVFLKHQISSSTFTFAAPITGIYQLNETIRGGTSNATGAYLSNANSTTMSFFTTSQTPFANGEVVTGEASGATATVSAITLGDYDRQYIECPNTVISVTRILPPYENLGTTDILFDPLAQFNISLLYNFTSTGVIPYYVQREYYQMLNDLFRGRPMIQFERHKNQLRIDGTWKNYYRPGNFIIIECYRVIDPGEFSRVWNDRWLQRYTTTLIKRQWGMNLSKYSGIALPGNVTFDGRAMLTEANQEAKDLEQELQSTWQEPPQFFVG